jgi:hypothetical protein
VVVSSGIEGPQAISSRFQLTGNTCSMVLVEASQLSCVFDGMIQDIKDDGRIWCMVGAKELSSLWHFEHR